jgi:hypothetical protein
MFALYTQPPQARDMSYWPSQPHTFRLDCVFFSSTLNFFWAGVKLDSTYTYDSFDLLFTNLLALVHFVCLNCFWRSNLFTENFIPILENRREMKWIIVTSPLWIINNLFVRLMVMCNCIKH